MVQRSIMWESSVWVMKPQKHFHPALQSSFYNITVCRFWPQKAVYFSKKNKNNPQINHCLLSAQHQTLHVSNKLKNLTVKEQNIFFKSMQKTKTAKKTVDRFIRWKQNANVALNLLEVSISQLLLTHRSTLIETTVCLHHPQMAKKSVNI